MLGLKMSLRPVAKTHEQQPISSHGPVRPVEEKERNWKVYYTVTEPLTQIMFGTDMTYMTRIARQKAIPAVESNLTPEEGERFESTSRRYPRTLVIISGGVIDGPPRRIRVNAQNVETGKVFLVDKERLANPKYFTRVI